jgi:diguanylate cyclase (GGDEF)-like protein/PAS domain S-box-containing protein
MSVVDESDTPAMTPATRARAQPTPPRRWAERLVGTCGGALALIWLDRLLFPGGSVLDMRIAPVILMGLALPLTVVVWRSPAPGASGRPEHRAWQAVALAMSAWWIATLLWVVIDRPALLSWSDPVQMLFYPLMLGGIRRFSAEASRRSVARRFWLDSAIAVWSGAAGIWYFVIWPSISRGMLGPAAVLINAVYPIGDLLVLFAACVALGRRAGRGSRQALAWVTAGLVARFIADLAYGWQAAAGTYGPGSLADACWLTSFWLMATGAVAYGRALSRPVASDRSDDDDSRWIRLLPYASVALVVALLLSSAPASLDARALGVLISAVSVTALVLARQFLVTREHARLSLAMATRESEARFRALVQHSSDIFAVLDASGTVSYVSPSVERVFNHRAADLLGGSVFDLVHPDDLGRARESFRMIGSDPGDGVPVQVRLRRADGTWRQMEIVGTDLTAEPAVNGIVVTARDVTERAALQAQLAHQAFHDPLTGLANRALFQDRVEHALARRARASDRVAVLFLDLDDFKTVNDSMGHGAGDRLLSEVAERLLNATRGCDTVARLGGDEFAVLLENVATDTDAVAVADRIAQALHAPVSLHGSEMTIGASIGIARARAVDGAGELLRNADVAMYKAKSRGRGGHEIFAPAMHAAILNRLELEADLRRAVADPTCAEFALHYQPIVELEGGRVIGVEALVRWHHPRRGLVSPASFIPIAESCGLIIPLGAWVLRQACAQAAEWRAACAVDGETAPFSVTVNLSGRQLQHPAIHDEVRAALDASGLEPSSLVLEITETVIMSDSEASLQTLGALKALGVRLAIDDFGTGYSSLSYLQKFPVDVIKIDKSFVDGAGRGGSDSALARTIVALGNMLGLGCVAEGIEEESQREHLRAIGCAYGQGFLFSRPLPADEVAALLRDGRSMAVEA